MAILIFGNSAVISKNLILSFFLLAPHLLGAPAIHNDDPALDAYIRAVYIPSQLRARDGPLSDFSESVKWSVEEMLDVLPTISPLFRTPPLPRTPPHNRALSFGGKGKEEAMKSDRTRRKDE